MSCEGIPLARADQGQPLRTFPMEEREGFGTIFGDENDRTCDYMRIRIIYPKRFIREDV